MSKPVRECGACSACCFALGVVELGKAAEQPCLHLRAGGGCSCYQVRPAECAAYRCLWLSGEGADEDRPDKTDIVMHTGGNDATGPFITIFPARADAFSDPQVHVRIARIAARSLCVIVSGDSRKVAGPDADVNRFRTAARNILRVIKG